MLVGHGELDTEHESLGLEMNSKTHAPCLSSSGKMNEKTSVSQTRPIQFLLSLRLVWVDDTRLFLFWGPGKL